MKILKLEAENFKRLKAIEITPTSNLVQITGANEQGKSSIIDAIWWALKGAEMCKATGTSMAIKDGEKKAVVKLDLGDMIITRKESLLGSSLTIENKKGLIFKSPQSLLDGLVGKIAFDPLSFAQMKEADQKATLQKLVPLEIDLEALAIERKTLYDSRTDVNRTIKQLQAQRDGIEPYPASTPDEEIKSGDIFDELKSAQLIITDNTKRRNQIEALLNAGKVTAKAIEAIDIEIAEIKKRLAIAEERKVKWNEQIAVDRANYQALNVMIEDPDISTFNAKLEQVEAINKNVRAKKQRNDILFSIKSFEESIQDIEFKMSKIDCIKTKALKEAKFPIEHLSFSETGVTYKEIPFLQCSSAERLRVSLAMAIAMNPRLKVLRITDGSLIDSKNMAIINEMIKDADYQCWIEKVDESGKIGIYIEDGEIKAVN